MKVDKIEVYENFKNHAKNDVELNQAESFFAVYILQIFAYHQKQNRKNRKQKLRFLMRNETQKYQN